jgi:hypothetical protein
MANGLQQILGKAHHHQNLILIFNHLEEIQMNFYPDHPYLHLQKVLDIYLIIMVVKHLEY